MNIEIQGPSFIVEFTKEEFDGATVSVRGEMTVDEFLADKSTLKMIKPEDRNLTDEETKKVISLIEGTNVADEFKIKFN